MPRDNESLIDIERAAEFKPLSCTSRFTGKIPFYEMILFNPRSLSLSFILHPSSFILYPLSLSPMPNSIMYSEDAYVVLEPNQPEQFLTAPELFEKLKIVLAAKQDDLPRDLQKFTSLDQQTQYLMETSCEIDVSPGYYLQWYAVRLEK
jgi:Protein CHLORORESPIRATORY REDUCTION 7